MIIQERNYEFIFNKYFQDINIYLDMLVHHSTEYHISIHQYSQIHRS